MRRAPCKLTGHDHEVELLMPYLKCSIRPQRLLGRMRVLRCHLTDPDDEPGGWCVVRGGGPDLCVHNPGRTVEIPCTTRVKTMTDIRRGERRYRKAASENRA